jgi:hypothetical protein
MREPRLEPIANKEEFCPYCGRDNLNLDMGFCRDCNEYMVRNSMDWAESFEDWLDKAFENKLKAQGCL